MKHDLVVMIGGRRQEREFVAEPIAHPAVSHHEAQDPSVEFHLLRNISDVDAAVRQQRIDR
jgi:hypothetical protein